VLIRQPYCTRAGGYHDRHAAPFAEWKSPNLAVALTDAHHHPGVTYVGPDEAAASRQAVNLATQPDAHYLAASGDHDGADGPI
jgi:hypothetical protein